MLRVVDDLATGGAGEGHRVPDHRQVLVGRRAEHLGHVQQPALAKDRDDRRLGLDERPKVGVVLGLVQAMPGRAERRQLG